MSRPAAGSYLCAQFVVVPCALLCLYRRAPSVYRRLRDTVLVTWMLAVPIYVVVIGQSDAGLSP